MLFLLTSLFFLNKEMRKNQQKLDRAERELELRRSIEDCMGLGVLITDRDDKIVYANNSLSRLTGYNVSELMNKEPPYPFWGDSSPIPSSFFKNVPLKDEMFPIHYDLTVRNKDDETFDALILLSPFKSPYNENIGWIYMILDNTLEASSKILINDAIASYQRLLNSVLSCISVVTHKPSGSLLGIHNNVYNDQLGNTVEGHLIISKAFKAPFDAQGTREGEVWVDELSRWFDVSEARITLPGGSHVTMQTALDITDKKNSEKTLEEQTSKMEVSSRLITLGEMASTITHEINQPLTAITAYANTALEVLGNSPNLNRNQVLEVFQKIATQAGRIDKIIKNIRSFAKRRPTTMECVPLANVINDSVELSKLLEKKYGNIRVVYEIPKSMPNVLCDPVQIIQILMNLIRNAADAVTEHKSPDGTITVSAKISATDVCIAVADRGPGINDTMKASLFTPFFSTKKNGLGLGLSTCQTIAESHNTRIQVFDNPGGGTIFSFELRICSDSN